MADRKPLVLINGAVAECPNTDRLVHGGVIQGTQLNATNGVVVAGGVITMGNLGLCTNLNANYLNGKSAPSGNIVGTTDAQTLTGKTIAAGSNTITGLDIAGTLANLPKTGLSEGMIYRPTDPGLHSFRWNGTYWQTLSTGAGIPLVDGLTHLSAPTYRWVATGAGTNEYACELAAGGNPSLTEPALLYINDAEATKGTAGSLSAGTWGWGSYSGFNTVHVRLSDGTNPDDKAYGYVKADVHNWVGGAGTATALIQSGVPLLSVNSGGGTDTLRTIQQPVSGTWTYFSTVKIVPSFTATSGAGIAVSDGTKFRSLCVVTDPVTGTLRLRVANWDTNTTGFTDLGINFPLEYIMSHGDITLAAVDNGTNVQFFAGAHNGFMRNVYQVSRLTHVTPTSVGPCVYTKNDIGRAWFPQRRLV